MVVLIVATVATAEWLGDEGVAGTVLLVIGVGLGAYFGVGWGNEEATKTDRYRREWLSKRAFKHQGSVDPPASTTDRNDSAT